MERRRSCPFNCSHPREHPIDTTLVFSTVRFDLTKYTFQRHFEGRGGLGSISWKAVHGGLDSPEGVRGDFTGRRPRGPCEGFVAARVALPNAKGVDRLWNVGSGCDNDRLSFFSLSLSPPFSPYGPSDLSPLTAFIFPRMGNASRVDCPKFFIQSTDSFQFAPLRDDPR